MASTFQDFASPFSNPSPTDLRPPPLAPSSPLSPRHASINPLSRHGSISPYMTRSDDLALPDIPLKSPRRRPTEINIPPITTTSRKESLATPSSRKSSVTPSSSRKFSLSSRKSSLVPSPETGPRPRRVVDAYGNIVSPIDTIAQPAPDDSDDSASDSDDVSGAVGLRAAIRRLSVQVQTDVAQRRASTAAPAPDTSTGSRRGSFFRRTSSADAVQAPAAAAAAGRRRDSMWARRGSLWRMGRLPSPTEGPGDDGDEGPLGPKSLPPAPAPPAVVLSSSPEERRVMRHSGDMGPHWTAGFLGVETVAEDEEEQDEEEQGSADGGRNESGATTDGLLALKAPDAGAGGRVVSPFAFPAQWLCEGEGGLDSAAVSVVESPLSAH